MKNLLLTSILSVLLIGFCLPATAQYDRGSTVQQIENILDILNAGGSIDDYTIQVRDIRFKYNSAELEPTTLPYLDKIVVLMNRVQTIDLKINGHTDNSGNDEYNLGLSFRRANSVMNYLITRGVSPQKMQSKGFGSTLSIGDNTTESGRAINRRVEVQVNKKREYRTVQDMIVFKNGTRKGVTIISITEDNQIRYRDFKDGKIYLMNPLEQGVLMMIYANGTERRFEQVVEKKAIPVAKPKKKETAKNDDYDFWAEADSIYRMVTRSRGQIGVGSYMVDFTYAANTNLPIQTSIAKNIVPPVGFSIDYMIYDNVSVGGGLEYRLNRKAGYNYHYYAFMLRTDYHLNPIKKLDVYAGLRGSYRGNMLVDGKLFTGNERVNRNSLTVNMSIGARYYLTNNFGVVAELGNDGISKASVGLSFLIKPKEKKEL